MNPTLNVHPCAPNPRGFYELFVFFFDLSDVVPLPSHHVQIYLSRKEAKNKKREISKSSEFYDRFANQNSSRKRGYIKVHHFYVSHNNLEQQNFYRFCRRVDSCLRLLGFWFLINLVFQKWKKYCWIVAKFILEYTQKYDKL